MKTTTATQTRSAPATVVKDSDLELKEAYSQVTEDELELAEAGLQDYRKTLQREEEAFEN